ncbi:MAG: di-heme oxidoreductase family protein [Shimia sp.]|uniref:di-heme oxidoreductase family protein n=1 Tax=Shimia sp. TaxID=1954381 RepID=UPI0040592B42
MSAQKKATWGVAAGLVCVGWASAGENLAEPHLSVVPRTAQEQARIDAILQPPTDFSEPEAYEALSGGAATVPRRTDGRAFSQVAKDLPEDQRLDFELGRAMFEKLWVASPSSTRASDGLGPLYHARSCGSCHVNDGRGFAGTDGVLIRVSVPDGDGGTMPHPTYGGQLQHKALSGMQAEVQLTISYDEVAVALAGGESASLRVPNYDLDLTQGPLGDGAMISARVAPAMIGLGLLEAIPSETILALADTEDANNDGISGRANVVTSAEFGVPMLGRFGHKATLPTVSEQAAAAFSADLGLSTPLFPWHWGDCSEAQVDCRAAPHGGDPEREGLEVDSRAMGVVNLYSRNLAVPARSDVTSPMVLRGKELFHVTGCADCHTPKHVTHRLDGAATGSFQLIWPYTDLLLHDMGDGLADGRPDGSATGREWRTAPLWGLGLVAQVGGQQGYLHDGRARTVLEAVLWHGGEAEAAKDKVVTMSPEDRAALLAFLESL